MVESLEPLEVGSPQVQVSTIKVDGCCSLPGSPRSISKRYKEATLKKTNLEVPSVPQAATKSFRAQITEYSVHIFTECTAICPSKLSPIHLPQPAPCHSTVHTTRTAAGLMHRVPDACNVRPEREGLMDQVAAPLGSDTPRGRRGVLIRARVSAGTHLALPVALRIES